MMLHCSNILQFPFLMLIYSFKFGAISNSMVMNTFLYTCWCTYISAGLYLLHLEIYFTLSKTSKLVYDCFMDASRRQRNVLLLAQQALWTPTHLHQFPFLPPRQVL